MSATAGRRHLSLDQLVLLRFTVFLRSLTVGQSPLDYLIDISSHAVSLPHTSHANTVGREGASHRALRPEAPHVFFAIAPLQTCFAPVEKIPVLVSCVPSLYR